MGFNEEDKVDSAKMPLLQQHLCSSPSSSSSPPSTPPTQTMKLPHKRTGNEWTALAHLITAAIGSGVLSLAWSVAQLGWIAGPLSMLCFACVSLTSALLLCNCHKSTDPECGTIRHGSYLVAVQSILGKKNAWFCAIIVQIYFIKVAIVYTITTASSIGAILKSNCYHYEGHDAACSYSTTIHMVIFGAVQVLVSQVRDFQDTKWLSVVAAIMSFTYSFIGAGLGLAKIIENGEIKGSITGLPSDNAVEKVWSVAQALGDIAFAFPFSLVFLNIQDTLKETPPEKVTMKKASTIAVCITTFFYLCCGGFGYAAFGTNTPGNLLTGFGFYEPYWLVDIANAAVIVHLVGAYQVYTQPFYANVESWLGRKFPESEAVHRDYDVKLLLLPGFRLNLVRLIFRTAYVATVTGIAALFPFFNQVVGVAGALTFWPVIVYFPVEMYLKQKRIESWTTIKIVLRTFSYTCLVVIVFAFVGSVRGLIVARFS
ncbi:PREDICTED: probable amino acid permease 7 [Ipomoea nil]|uniref:probable amino acid permease 7 n=1 Tax=Ipomoea nil TaxID=35883 RepID=UPI0009019610|nr:PREDICTED: probable amino acid permease 7 [Ipomoea nil]